VFAVSAYSTIGIPLIPGAARPTAAVTTYATLLFADLHGYDALAERLAPVKVLPLLGEYFSVLTGAILEFGGQIIQLAEAELLAGFGVGDPRHSQIHEAVSAARTIQQRFAPIRASWQSKHSIDTGVGIGIHRGEVAIGTFGPLEQGATLVGDAAHLAAQLSRRARAGEVMLSAAVHLPQKSAMPLLHLPQLKLRGRSTPLDVWCVPAPTRLQLRHAGLCEVA
jgi:adenylate cyclase